ncbi:MAG: AAA family ATPase [Elusimicrobia bacterium]|nr:AAA family ATPase [Candidatus Liberimonas magnetica]
MTKLLELKTYKGEEEQLFQYFNLVKLLIQLKELKKDESTKPEKIPENPVDQEKQKKKHLEQEKEVSEIYKNISLQKNTIRLTTEATLKDGKVRLPLEIMRKRYNLREYEVIVICIIALNTVDPTANIKTEKANLLYLVCEGDYDRILLSNWMFDHDAALFKNKLIVLERYRTEMEIGDMARKFIYPNKANDAVLDKYIKSIKVNKSVRLFSPREIYAQLSKTVIGQERAKKMISVAAHTHLKRISIKKGALKPGKSNFMLIGPTGSGKTLIARTLAEILDVPMIIVDSTEYTEKGFVGGDVDDMIEQLCDAARGDMSRAEKGIVFIDEIDKIAARDCSVGHNTGRDVSGKSVQEELLRFLDGAQTIITIRSGFSTKTMPMDLSNVLFIAGGAFANMRTNLCQNQQIAGFTGSKDACPAHQAGVRVHSELSNELIDYGMIPEFVGRFPILVELSELTKTELIEIISKPSNSILSQYRSLYGDISFSEDALEFIVEQSMKRKVGARGLRAILEETLSPIIFDMAINTEKFELKLTKEDLLKQA